MIIRRESTKTDGDAAQITELDNPLPRARGDCGSTEELQERSDRPYELERHYASGHFERAESMRNLKIERLRNASAFADRDIILQRARDLQARFAGLRDRLSKYEEVEDRFFCRAPIVKNDA